MIYYSAVDIMLYMLIYSFIAWFAEVCYFSLKNKRFINRGFINLPFNMSYGIISLILINILPTFDKNYILQFAAVIILLFAAESITAYFIENIGRLEAFEYIDEDNISNSILYISKTALAVVCVLIYTVVHPVIFTFVNILPDTFVTVTSIILWSLIILDFIGTIFAMRTGVKGANEDINNANRNVTRKIAGHITEHIWRRMENSYPGIKTSSKRNKYTFAEGICFDKLIWVFLISALMGDIIETFYCRIVGGVWMNRSSVLYGPFSIVWGLGAVVLTIVLRKLHSKSYFKIFIAGFFIGGAYEYICSVVTEIVFGTVFWDYSYMPLNIGGRTNVLFCVFWGILAVVWIRFIYPPMSNYIEKMPVLWGKIITFTILAIMLCNSLLTAGAMVRYNVRQTDSKADNVIETFLDTQYNDEYMENRWPNMILTE